VLPFWIGEMALGRTIVWSTATIVAIASVALFSSVLAYILWNRGVEAVGAPVAGLYIHLMPVFGVLLAWVFLGERFMLHHAAGIALILVGIAITTRRGRAVAPAGTD
jgi:drug/metabolite transporter (DMT)-like permease